MLSYKKWQLSTGIINISDFCVLFNINIEKLSTKNIEKFLVIHKNSFLTALFHLIYNWFGVFKRVFYASGYRC